MGALNAALDDVDAVRTVGYESPGWAEQAPLLAPPEGMADAKAGHLAIREPRYAVNKAGKKAKDPLNMLKKDIDVRVLKITNELVAIETPIHEQIKVEKDRVAAEKAAVKTAREAATAKVQTAIDEIRNPS